MINREEVEPGEYIPKSRILSRLPTRVKNFLLKCFWAWFDLRDFLAEIIGWIPSNHIRLFFWKMLGLKIGKHVSIHRNCRMYVPNNVNLKDHCVILRDVLLDGRKGIQIGSNVSISEGVQIYSLQHNINSPKFGLEGGLVEIRDYVFIGAKAIILPGIIIGEGCIVAAGSVVSRSTEPYSVVAGVPAQKIGMRSRQLAYKLNYRKLFG